MKIVVTTPTGKVGSRVVHLLVQAGVRPTLLTTTLRAWASEHLRG